ncbi:MAG: ABC transporter ATP-binding protein [Gammaproteobacteria bacterium]|nr:ABC transporter ATP-binding protein [Gammaproteobacteria bacterium]NNM00116.1 ABC transporter ATP-binding protein [Gammaproteobacteria bacterium]
MILYTEELGRTVTGPHGELTILDGINFHADKGERVAVLGVSGSGKSTLLSLLAGIDLPSRGRVVLAGDDLTTLTEDQRATLRAQHIGFVFQSFHLIANLTALENVMLPLELAEASRPAERGREVLELVGLGHRLDHFPRQLSGGEQQRVAIARAFAPSPSLLLADEPTGNLDRDTAATVIELLFDLNARNGTTLILVTHDEALAARCDRTVRLAAGRVVDAAPSETAQRAAS